MATTPGLQRNSLADETREWTREGGLDQKLGASERLNGNPKKIKPKPPERAVLRAPTPTLALRLILPRC
jgi:hypothetical protein